RWWEALVWTRKSTPRAVLIHDMRVNKLSFGFPQSEMIRYYGYPCEEYEVTTKDGYILGVFRIPSGRNMQNTGKKPAVLLHHGTFADCTYWISNLPRNSLGFILADVGYDVWLGNSRGNTWSSKHKTLKPCQKEFWQFSFHEIGIYDLPAELDFIMNKTGQKDVYYVGHSEGSTAGFVAFSTYPELAQRVKVFFALGPVATITYATSPFVKFARLPQPLIRVWPTTLLCATLGKLCARIFCFIAGGSIQNLNTSRTDAFVAHYPAGTSVQNTIHWHQRISTPIAVWSGGQDKFAGPKDIAKLLSQITNLFYYKHFPEWGHLDFVWGLDATERMYRKIIELMTKYA
uniref:Partial AB-hydrolase lipase domain-containing protein n=1 Tax=Cairina moschata TaxID=8855 RepID=A0A8C3BYH1_CAIMO